MVLDVELLLAVFAGAPSLDEVVLPPVLVGMVWLLVPSMRFCKSCSSALINCGGTNVPCPDEAAGGLDGAFPAWSVPWVAGCPLLEGGLP